ncbi:MAG: family 10 glycosylhydrolase [Leptolyngbya sp.]|nr:family 10 glycosylhydrolase [Leptolyngbya sp.]
MGQRKWLGRLGCFVMAWVMVMGLHSGLPLWAATQPPNGGMSSGSALAQALPTEDPNPLLPPPAVIPIDIRQHWAKDCLTALAQAQIITADASARFYPDDSILWGDYVAMLNRLIPPGQAGSWANPLEQALGLTTAPTVASHYPSQYYQPDRPLVRAEGIMALAAKLGSNYQIVANTWLNQGLVDGRQVPAYAREGVAAALAQAMIVNYPDANRIHPTQRLTRGEAAALICRADPNLSLRQWIDPAWVPMVTPPDTVPVPLAETRGVWLTNIDSQVLFSTEALTAGVNQLAELNFNTLYPAVWNWGYTLYPSRTAERELGVSQHLYADLRAPQRGAVAGARDMMQEAVDLGHAKGMAVIPWFEFGFMTPEPYDLYRRHPDWFTHKRVDPPSEDAEADKSQAKPGATVGVSKIRALTTTEEASRQKMQALGRDLSPVKQDDPGNGLSPEVLADPGIWLEGGRLPRRWLSPFHPQARRFLLQLIDELVSNYDVDGFQFDDHLGLPVEFGYDAYTVNLYKAEHNGQEPPINAQDPEWMAWRANKISDFLAEVYQMVKTRRPNAVISISPNPHPFAYANYLQDWPTWVNRGIVDELIVQIYRSDQNRFIWEINKPYLQSAMRKVPTNVGILSGLRAAPVAMDHIGDQIKAVRDRRLSGMSFFFYESLWMPAPTERREHRMAGLQRAFASTAPRPSGPPIGPLLRGRILQDHILQSRLQGG